MTQLAKSHKKLYLITDPTKEKPMNRKILLFNLVFYTVTLLFFAAGEADPSSSLGYGLFIGMFWIAAAIVLIAFLVTKRLRAKTIADKIGVVTATPVLCLIFLAIHFAVSPTDVSEYIFTSNNYKHKIIESETNAGARIISYYKSARPADSVSGLYETWLKDSVWLYISRNGDTIKKVRYKDDHLVK
jgi:hypothetical protein